MVVNWANIPKVLSLFSWDAKVAICGKYASRIMSQGRCWISEKINELPTPWELNQFAILSAIYQDGSEREIPDPIFRSVINLLREPIPQKPLKSFGAIKKYLSFRCGMIQFPYQQDSLMRFFRYKYLLSFEDHSSRLDVPKIF